MWETTTTIWAKKKQIGPFESVVSKWLGWLYNSLYCGICTACTGSKLSQVHIIELKIVFYPFIIRNVMGRRRQPSSLIFTGCVYPVHKCRFSVLFVCVICFGLYDVIFGVFYNCVAWKKLKFIGNTIDMPQTHNGIVVSKHKAFAECEEFVLFSIRA